MSYSSLILSSAGLKNIVQNRNHYPESEFRFIFGQHEIKMNNIFAEFISPFVSQIHRSDPTIEYIEFSNKTYQKSYQFIEKINDDVFSLFEKLSQGESISISKEQSKQLQIISILLKNIELFNKINELFKMNTNEENFESQVEFVTFLEENPYMIDMSEQSNSIKYIASHLYSIDKNKVIKLPKNVFYLIVKNKFLMIENEDSLLELINEFFDKNTKLDKNDIEPKLSIIDFYEEIDFDFLSEDKFKEFIENFDPNEITTSLWLKLKRCFYVNKNLPKENIGNRYNPVGTKFEYDGQNQNAFKGIICHLTKECGGNVDDKGVVKVTASSIFCNSSIAKYAVDLNDCTHYFETNNIENSWLQYDFKNQKVHPTHYTIRTRHDGGKGNNHPKKWDIEGSNDGNKWITLDSRQDITCLDDKNAIHTFDIQSSQQNNEFYQFLRIRFTGLNTANNNYTALSALEYFGTIIKS